MVKNVKRGRPIGSTNKKNTSNVFVAKFEKQIDGSPITRNSSQGYVFWGLKNDYPNLLLNLYNESPTHRSAINFGVQSILGNGVDYDAMALDSGDVVPNYYETWDMIIKNLALDFMLYGSYALQIIKNKDKKTYSFYHMPIEKVRWSPYDEDGQITTYWISNDWTAVGQNPPFEIDAFDMRDENVIEQGRPYLYVYRDYSPTQNYYTSPHYTAAIKSIQSEIEFINYDLKHIVNGFSTAGILTLPEVETDEEKKAIINNIQAMFQGSNNTNQIAITFRTNLEDKPAEWTPFSDKNINTDRYAESNKRCISRILSAHQIPSPMLIGMPDVSNAGFSSDADKIETAYQLYQKLTGNYNRLCVIKTLNQMLRMNGVETEIIMKPLKFNDFGDKDDNAQETKSTDTNDNIATSNIEEQKDGNNKKDKE